MTGTGATRAIAGPGPIRGLRAASLAALVMLVVQYGFGMWVNLYGHLPASDHGAGVPVGVADAVTGGPVGLGIHAVLGLALVVTAISVIVRASLVRRPLPVVAAVIGLVAILVAGLGGARFVGHAGNSASMAMALATGVAILSYAVVLFALPAVERPAPLPLDVEAIGEARSGVPSSRS